MGCLQMRSDRKAAVEASGAVEGEEDEDELDDSFYPTKLPSRWVLKKRGELSGCASCRHCGVPHNAHAVHVIAAEDANLPF
jgi:hypothetical protein